MDPTTLAPMSPSASVSPYAANVGPAGSINPNQLAAIIQALQAKESQGGASPPAAGQPQSIPGGQGQPAQKPPVTDISGLIPSLMHPPPTSILGKIEGGIGSAFGGQPSGVGAGGSPMMAGGYQPMAGDPMNIMPPSGMNGGASPAPMLGAPGAFGSSAVPTPFASPGSPDAMTQMLMGGAPGF